jgi:uncharacterized protein (DUF1778 family)
MVSTAFLMDTDQLARALARETRSERMEQRIKPTMKQAIEFAAALSGADTSEFVSTAAFRAALEKINSMRVTRLFGEDAERFFTALDRRRGPNEAMRRLTAEHDEGLGEDAG